MLSFSYKGLSLLGATVEGAVCSSQSAVWLTPAVSLGMSALKLNLKLMSVSCSADIPVTATLWDCMYFLYMCYNDITVTLTFT